MKTWLSPETVFAQVGLAGCDCDLLARAIHDASVQLAFRHGLSPAEVLAHYAGLAAAGGRWAEVRDELERVFTHLEYGEG